MMPFDCISPWRQLEHWFAVLQAEPESAVRFMGNLAWEMTDAAKATGG